MNLQERSTFVKQKASELGFFACGISRAEFLEQEAPRLDAWLKAGMHGEMGYMERNFDKRLDPTKLVEGARSVVSVLFNYYSNKAQTDPEAPKISRYAYGTDYHEVVKDKLHLLLQAIREQLGEAGGRVFVDSAPVLDRAWAARSGLGWIGKNTNLINKGSGSFYFLGELILDMDFAYDEPLKTDHCGTCTACIDACPTQAIVSPSVVDGSKCISYFTIELKAEIPTEVTGKLDNWMFGCDVCQDVCPWNRFSKPHQEPLFEPLPELMDLSKADWEQLTAESFRKLFGKSPVKRAGYNGLKRNIVFLKK